MSRLATGGSSYAARMRQRQSDAADSPEAVAYRLADNRAKTEADRLLPVPECLDGEAVGDYSERVLAWSREHDLRRTILRRRYLSEVEP